LSFSLGPFSFGEDQKKKKKGKKTSKLFPFFLSPFSVSSSSQREAKKKLV